MWKVVHEILNGMAEFPTAVGGVTTLLVEIMELRFIKSRGRTLGGLAFLKRLEVNFLH